MVENYTSESLRLQLYLKGDNISHVISREMTKEDIEKIIEYFRRLKNEYGYWIRWQRQK